MAAAAGFDLRTRRIPNPLILVGLVLALAAQWMTLGVPGLIGALLGAFTALALLILPFARKMLGGGDVKLGMLIGAWTGTLALVHVLLYGAVFTGIISGLFWLYQYYRPVEVAPRIPIAVPLGAATILYTAALLPTLLVSHNS